MTGPSRRVFAARCRWLAGRSTPGCSGPAATGSRARRCGGSGHHARTSATDTLGRGRRAVTGPPAEYLRGNVAAAGTTKKGAADEDVPNSRRPP